ncbi:MAG: YidC/Oxa1 family membrane protein insertase, partial [bacterium]
MDFCYTVIIYPITLLMEFVLRNMISITNSSLLSLIFLSFVITIVSFPFSFIAEKWQDKEREIQKKLKPKIDEFKSVFKGVALNNYITTLYRQNNYHPVFAVRSSIGFIIQIPFFLAAYIFISNYEPLSGTSVLFFKDLGGPDRLIQIKDTTINVMPFVMTAANLLYAFVYGRKLSFRENFHNYFISFAFLILLYNSSSALLIYWTSNNLFGIVKNGVLKVCNKKLSSVSLTGGLNRSYSLNYFLALFSFALLVFFTVPFALLASGSGYDIDGTFFDIMSFQLMLFVVFVVMMTLLFYFSSGILKKMLAGIISGWYLYSLFNAFVFPGDYGDMTNFFFEEGLTVMPADSIFNLLILLIIAVTVSILFYFKKIDLVNTVFLLLMVSVFSFSFYEGIIFYDKVKDKDTVSADKFDKKFTFSKNNKNVVVILFDRFIGGYIPELTELIPELKDEILDGFVWYSNSLSSGSDTLSSEPSIMGGWDYHADTINKTRTNVPLLDKMDESIRIMPYNFSKAGYNSYIYGYLSSWMKRNNPAYLNDTVVEDLTGKYLDIWMEKQKTELVKSEFMEKLAVFGLFRISPPFLRETIYDDGHWNLPEKEPLSIMDKT